MKKLIVCLMLLFTAVAQGANWTNGSQLVDATIWRPGYHGFYVKAENYHDPEGCSKSGLRNLYLFDPSFDATDTKTIDRLYSMILTAQTSGKKLHVFVDGCISGAPRISGLQMNQ